MASLDFIENSSKGYAFIWHNRAYIFQNAIPVVFIKVLCILTIYVFGVAGNPLREGIFLLSSHALEAFFIIRLIRFYLYHEPIHIWGKIIPVPQNIVMETKKQAPFLDRKIAIQAGVAIYLLTKIGLGFLIGIMAINVPNEYQAISEPSLEKALLSLVMLTGILWSLRLLWLFVPAGMGFRPTDFLRKINGIVNSLYFIGVLIICSIPLLLLYSFGINILESLFGQASAINIILSSILQAFFVITTLCLQSVAICHGVYDLMAHRGKS